MTPILRSMVARKRSFKGLSQAWQGFGFFSSLVLRLCQDNSPAQIVQEALLKPYFSLKNVIVAAVRAVK